VHEFIDPLIRDGELLKATASTTEDRDVIGATFSPGLTHEKVQAYSGETILFVRSC
jgi:hypothetical protein